MNPVQFPEATHKLAKDQPQYRVLPIRLTPVDIETGVNEYTAKYELSEIELAQINQTKSFYFTQTGNCFHPILPRLENPWKYLPVEYLEKNGNHTAWVPLADGSKEIVIGLTAKILLANILNKFPELTPESIWFYSKPELGVDEHGNIVGL